MAKQTMEMILEYAKVFPENADMGDPDGPNAAQAVHAKGGQYIVNAYFTSQEQIKTLLASGLQETVNGHPRIIDGNAEFGIGKYMKLKRQVEDLVKVFQDKSGKDVEVNYGGPVGVVDLRDPENKRWWSFEEDGPFGNGTKAMVHFDVYRRGSGVRLVNVGVTDHVPYEAAPSGDSGDELFKVA